ncbi:hypothetical protein [Burkholderia cepacia]|uniref:hypothetical protein n=1 Tax=Burkholderia cepacia TaxID=292 RepID=UPI0012DAECF2|nr:hypothetical protein [Burkholderia cepacia]
MREPSARNPHLRENTGTPPAISGSSRFALRNSKRTVAGSTTTAFVISAKYAPNCGAASLLFSVSNENLTSLAVTGSPLEKRARGFRWNVTERRSGAMSMSSASSPYADAGSSELPVARLSNSMSMPGAGLPRIVNGLNLSNEVSRFGFASTSVPPFGASGFT